MSLTREDKVKCDWYAIGAEFFATLRVALAEQGNDAPLLSNELECALHNARVSLQETNLLARIFHTNQTEQQTHCSELQIMREGAYRRLIFLRTPDETTLTYCLSPSGALDYLQKERLYDRRSMEELGNSVVSYLPSPVPVPDKKL